MYDFKLKINAPWQTCGMHIMLGTNINTTPTPYSSTGKFVIVQLQAELAPAPYICFCLSRKTIHARIDENRRIDESMIFFTRERQKAMSAVRKSNIEINNFMEHATWSLIKLRGSLVLFLSVVFHQITRGSGRNGYKRMKINAWCSNWRRHWWNASSDLKLVCLTPLWLDAFPRAWPVLTNISDLNNLIVSKRKKMFEE